MQQDPIAEALWQSRSSSWPLPPEIIHELPVQPCYRGISPGNEHLYVVMPEIVALLAIPPPYVTKCNRMIYRKSAKQTICRYAEINKFSNKIVAGMSGVPVKTATAWRKAFTGNVGQSSCPAQLEGGAIVPGLLPLVGMFAVTADKTKSTMVHSAEQAVVPS